MSRQTISFEDSSSSRVADFPSRFSSAKDLATTSSAPGAPAEEEGEEITNERKRKNAAFLADPRKLPGLCVEKPPKLSRSSSFFFFSYKSFKKVNFLCLGFLCLCLFQKKKKKRSSSSPYYIRALRRVGKTTTTTMHTAAAFAFAAALPMRPLI